MYLVVSLKNPLQGMTEYIKRRVTKSYQVILKVEISKPFQN